MPPRAQYPNRPAGMTDFVNLNSPFSPYAASAAADPFAPGGQLNPWGLPRDEVLRRFAAAEAAAADQNDFERGIKTGDQDIRRQASETDQQYKESLVQQAKDQLAFSYAQLSQQGQTAQGQLGLGTLSLGASLTGPRRWDQYLETAAAAGQNPQLQNAIGTWSSLTGIRPNTGAVSGPLPQKFDLNALASDFMGGGGASGQAGRRDANLDAVAMGQGTQPGWWQGLSDDEQQRAQGYWETRGWSPSSIRNSLAYQSPNQGLAYGGV